jgi:hypothetical protein
MTAKRSSTFNKREIRFFILAKCAGKLSNIRELLPLGRNEKGAASAAPE